jgi:hypothetical protein
MPDSRESPNRATLVSKLVVPDVRVEMIAYAHIDGK